MALRVSSLVADLGIILVLSFFCGLLGVYAGWDAASKAWLLVLLAYGAGRWGRH